MTTNDRNDDANEREQEELELWAACRLQPQPLGSPAKIVVADLQK
jgi:hypothetical protein